MRTRNRTTRRDREGPKEGRNRSVARKPWERAKVPTRPAHDYALFMLGRREYSQHELRQKMAGWNYEPEVIEETMTWLASEGYQSDQRYTQMAVRNQQGRYGDRHIKQILKHKGIDEETIAGCLAEGEDEEKRAGQIIRKFARCDLRDPKTKAKAYRFMTYRGFSYEKINKAWSDLGQGAGEDEEF